MKRWKTLLLAAVLCAALLAGCQSNQNKLSYRDAGIEALNAGDYKGAITSFDQAIKSSGALVGSFDLDVLKYKAEAEFGAKDYKAAADTYGVLIKADKKRPEYLNMRCVARMNSGDFAGAVEDYNQAVKLDKEKNSPGRMEALLAAGAALEGQGNAAGAEALYESREAEGIQSAVLYNQLGMCKLQLKDYEAALNYFTKGLSSTDAASVPELAYNQAVAYEYLGDFDQARTVMEQYVKGHEGDEKASRELEFLKSR